MLAPVKIKNLNLPLRFCDEVGYKVAYAANTQMWLGVRSQVEYQSWYRVFERVSLVLSAELLGN